MWYQHPRGCTVRGNSHICRKAPSHPQQGSKSHQRSPGTPDELCTPAFQVGAGKSCFQTPERQHSHAAQLHEGPSGLLSKLQPQHDKGIRGLDKSPFRSQARQHTHSYQTYTGKLKKHSAFEVGNTAYQPRQHSGVFEMSEPCN